MPMTLTALCDAAITVSSNLAANNLIEKLGAVRIQKAVDELGASGMQVKRGVEDPKAFDKGDTWLADRVYSGVPAGDYGREQQIRIGPMSGKSNVVFWLKRHHIVPAPESGTPA